MPTRSNVGQNARAFLKHNAFKKRAPNNGDEYRGPNSSTVARAGRGSRADVVGPAAESLEFCLLAVVLEHGAWSTAGAPSPPVVTPAVDYESSYRVACRSQRA